MRAKGIFIIVMLLMGFAWVKPAAALEAYSPAQTQQFTDWCTGAKAATEGVCSLTLKNLSKPSRRPRSPRSSPANQAAAGLACRRRR